MATDRIKTNENVYFRARKEAAIYNEKLNSRGNAADIMGISESSLADYELGLTKVVPVDKVVLIQDGNLEIKKKFGTMNSTAYKISSKTGMIGMPKKIRLSSENSIDNDEYGYQVTFFLNADIKISDFVYLDSKYVQGFFRVSEISMSGSNLDGDWTCTATLLENSTFVAQTTGESQEVKMSREEFNNSRISNRYITYDDYLAGKSGHYDTASSSWVYD